MAKIARSCQLLAGLFTLLFSAELFASEAELHLPALNVNYNLFGMELTGQSILSIGMVVALLGMLFGLVEFVRVKALPVHKSMADVSALIYETCKTYLFQQGKLLIMLEVFIGACIFYYFYGLQNFELPKVLLILLWSVLGILGSFSVAWFGIRMNTYANSRTAFASLAGKPYPVMDLPLRAGMSIGVLLICVELIMMLFILKFVSIESAGACFVGFAIGESLGASALRICGGIFTKIADIGSDLMKIEFKIKEDDARNPGVIADCTGDNAGDSVGPTADGFETYGVTGVALISFIVLAVGMMMDPTTHKLSLTAGGGILQAKLIVWIFAMRVLMIITSIGSYWINNVICKSLYGARKHFDFEIPLTLLVWITSIASILVTFGVSYEMISEMPNGMWWKLSLIISCGTLAAAIIPEVVKVFTSSKSQHVGEVVAASEKGGASLNILSGFVAGNFSAFWIGMVMVGLMLVAYMTSQLGLDQIMVYPAVFAFGLVAFGMLGMGPVTIAVDSYGPVTDNAQSVFELSQIESIPNVAAEIQRDFGFVPNFEQGKMYLEENDSAGNTFKATAKPVLIGTAVIGATTMIFSIILLLNLKLDLLDPKVLFGLMCGGAVIYWFTGASTQAVTTGAYRAVEFIKDNIRLDQTRASVEDSKQVVRICTQYAQAGMLNIFGVIFSFTLAFAFFDPTFFASYLISIAAFGLFQAMFMANAGGAWDNAKKVVEVDLRQKGTALHDAAVVGDTVGDPFKDTSSVALNPIIKFTTLFGLLAVEIAVAASPQVARTVGIVLFLVGLFFVWRSFYRMRISKGSAKSAATAARQVAHGK
jgi:K(+)-stimulated pyrophosphate-energized sodium pump